MSLRLNLYSTSALNSVLFVIFTTDFLVGIVQQCSVRGKESVKSYDRMETV